MIDSKYKVRRYIAEYSEETEKLLAEYELSAFDLAKFQKEFGEICPENPMFDCYPIKKSNVAFLKSYINEEPSWDFAKKSYFVEAHAI
jgi:hypothetical protein